MKEQEEEAGRNRRLKCYEEIDEEVENEEDDCRRRRNWRWNRT